MSTVTSFSRRQALLGLGTAAAVPLVARPAQAAGRVVVGTWGGDYARLLTKNIEDPILKPRGWEVVQDQASDAPRRAKMLAERRLPRGTVDIQGLSAANIHEVGEAGARLYPTNEAFAQAMQTQEIAIGMMWKARGVQWQNAGIPLQMVAPIEGVPMYVSGFAIQKNAPNKAGAYAYMDAMLEKSAQEAFAVDMGFNPTVTNAVVPPELHARIGFTPEETARLVDLDYAYLARENAAMKDWWDKVFKA